MSSKSPSVYGLILFFLVPISRNVSSFPSLVEYNGFKASWQGSWSQWYQRNTTGQSRSRMPGMSSARSQSSHWMGECRAFAVSRHGIQVLQFLSYLLSKSRYLYTLYLAVDANFKLKGKDWKLQDIELMPGQGIFVEESAYQTHIESYHDQPEVCFSVCGLPFTDTWKDQQLPIGTRCYSQGKHAQLARICHVGCWSGHVLLTLPVRKNGVGDLQKGKRSVLLSKKHSLYWWILVGTAIWIILYCQHW